MEIKRKPMGCFILSSEKMQTREEAFSHIAEVLKFPDYFGHNLDALEECLLDLEWLNVDNYIIVLLGEIDFSIRQVLTEVVKCREGTMLVIQIEGLSVYEK